MPFSLPSMPSLLELPIVVIQKSCYHGNMTSHFSALYLSIVLSEQEDSRLLGLQSSHSRHERNRHQEVNSRPTNNWNKLLVYIALVYLGFLLSSSLFELIWSRPKCANRSILIKDPIFLDLYALNTDKRFGLSKVRLNYERLMCKTSKETYRDTLARAIRIPLRSLPTTPSHIRLAGKKVSQPVISLTYD